MAFWGIKLEPGKSFIHRFDKARGRLHISQATLDIDSDAKEASAVRCIVGAKNPILLCAFFPKQKLSSSLDLEFEEEDDVVFTAIGPRSIYLTGFFTGVGFLEHATIGEKKVDVCSHPVENEVGEGSSHRKKRKCYINDQDVVVKKSKASEKIGKSMKVTDVIPEVANIDNMDEEPVHYNRKEKLLNEKICKERKDSPTPSTDVRHEKIRKSKKTHDSISKPNAKTDTVDDEPVNTDQKKQQAGEKVSGQRKDSPTPSTEIGHEKSRKPKKTHETKPNVALNDTVNEGPVSDEPEKQQPIEIVPGQPKDSPTPSTDLGHEKIRRPKKSHEAKPNTAKTEIVEERPIHSDPKEQQPNEKVSGQHKDSPTPSTEVGHEKIRKPKKAHDGKPNVAKTEIVEERPIDSDPEEQQPNEKLSEEPKHSAAPSMESGHETDESSKIAHSNLEIAKTDNMDHEPIEACGNDADTVNEGNNGTSMESSVEEVKEVPLDVRSFTSGLVIEELKHGDKLDGRVATPGCKVTVHYTGKLKSDGNIFDSTKDGPPFEVKLSANKVIKGWESGIGGMTIGERRRITVPPALGYGVKGAPAKYCKIPGNAWLEYEIELVDIR